MAERAAQQPMRVAYSFSDSLGVRTSLTYAQLWSEVRAMAAELQADTTPGDRVLLLCDPSLGYIKSFCAIVAAGLVAVPAYPVSATRHSDRVRRIIEDCNPALVVADAPAPLGDGDLGLPLTCRWIDLTQAVLSSGTTVPESPFVHPDLPDDALAFLQYTSGSTGSPKGVMVSHANLLHNAESAAATFGFRPESIMVSWLPPFHDMGLIGCIITPLVVGFPTHLMSPSTFLRRPLKWLETISELRATDSTAPNFAYRLCAERVDQADLTALDLSSWTKAMNGAEPVSVQALNAFAQAYASTGFLATSYRPCYGMAEATLLISGGHDATQPPRTATPVRETGGTDAGMFVSCGTVEPNAVVRIVDPATRVPATDGREGEIWVSSPSVAQGYWNRSDVTRDTFEATMVDGTGPFLRTGDLGFLDDGELFVTGRIKDVLIINGRNIYPQDLEDAVRSVHAAFRGRESAAFEIDKRVIVTVEAVPGREATIAELADEARAAAFQLARTFEIAAPTVIVLRRGTLTTTSSGKIQRSAAKATFSGDGHADRTIARSDADVVVQDAPAQSDPTVSSNLFEPLETTSAERNQVRDVVVAELARAAGRPGTLAGTTPLAELGLDSVKVASVATAIEDRTGITVPLSLAWEVDTVASFAAAVTRSAEPTERAAPEPAMSDSVAILRGAACRLPGGVTESMSYAELLNAGPRRSGIAGGERRTSGIRSGLTPSLAEFSPARFGIGDEEAAAMDPRQRLALTLAWEALEDSGRDPRRLRGASIGVFMGASDSEMIGDAAAPAGYRTTGAAAALIANRISYVLGLSGPSLVVDSACSSSLVAVHLALQALRSGEIDGALVGGVNALLDGRVSETLAQAGMLSPSGACRTFDDGADGYVRGEGGVVLFLTRDDVLASDRNEPEPYCVVRGSAVGQDGRSNGLTAPSGPAQQDVVRKALAAARRTPQDVGYIEAHGTGTPLGDPVEVHALHQVFGDASEPGARPLWIGSTKPQIGHLEAGAGVAGLLRAALIVRNGVIPPQAEFDTPSGRIDWAGSRLRVPTTSTEWDEARRTAGVSSFGFGGTNAHVVIESVTMGTTGSAGDGPVLVRIAAESEMDLKQQIQAVRVHESTEPTAALAAATEQSRVTASTRAWVVAEGSAPAAATLDRLASAPVASVPAIGIATVHRSVAFLAAGHGAPVAGVLAGIYGVDPVVTAVLDELGGVRELPLRALVVDDDKSRKAMRDTAVAQPAHFAVAVALGERLRKWGVEPVAIAGHSVGAFAAATLAGVFGVREGFALISRRGALMQASPEGGMINCQADLETARAIATDAGLDVAVSNSRSRTVLSGSLDALERAERLAEGRGVRTSRLPVTRGFHSRLMRDIEADLNAAVAAACPVRAVDGLFVSDIDGSLSAPVDDPAYWVRHACAAIDFGAAARQIAQCDLVIELGPNYLLPLVSSDVNGRMPATVAALSGANGITSLLEGTGDAWAAGADVGSITEWSGPVPRLARSVFATHTFPLAPTDVDAPIGGTVTWPGVAACTVAPDRVAVAASVDADEHAVRTSAVLWEDYLCDRLSVPLGVSPANISRNAGLFDLGLTSVIANELREDITAIVGRPLSSTIVFDYPTITHLASHLATVASATTGITKAPATSASTVSPDDNDKAHSRQHTAESPGAGPVSVIGMSCRLPGAESLTEFWSLITSGSPAMGEPPAGRWPDPATSSAGAAWSPRAGFLASDPAMFEAERFGISPREARSMDPQHRLLLELADDALTDAGVPRGELRGMRAGVWMGLSTTDYASLRPRSTTADAYAVTGNSPALASGRIAHYLGVEGPAVTIDTACSSSLVACHEAIRALRDGSVDLALVGGVNLMLSARTTAALGDMGALSSAGRCATFGENADGYARGEGGGVIVLRRSADAHARGERIHADLLGSAVNHDGISAGLTVPNGQAQTRLIMAALLAAGIGSEEVDYIEAHGTGTPLGDPIELEALARVFDHGRDRPLPVGSVKAQIGHLEAAAGIAALIKSVLVAARGVFPPHPHDIEPTSRFDWRSSRLELTTRPRPLVGAARIGGVSSFGFSGTNAHVVTASSGAVTCEPRPSEIDHPHDAPAPGPHLLLVSGDSDSELCRARMALAERLSDPANRLDIASRTSVSPGHGAHRLAMVADDAEEAVRMLRADDHAQEQKDPDRRDAQIGSTRPGRRATWLFSGVGSEWSGMVTHLAAAPGLRSRLNEADDLLRAMDHPGLFGDIWSANDRQEHLHPALTAIQVALAAELRAHGARRADVIGYSAGTIAALIDTGRLDLEMGLRIGAWRGRAVDAAVGHGATAACGLSPNAALESFLQLGLDDLVIASITGPANSTVSGDEEQLARLREFCQSTGKWWVPVSNRIPFHHPRLRDLLAPGSGGAVSAPPQISWHAGDGIPVYLASGTPVESLTSDPQNLLAELWLPMDLAATRTLVMSANQARTVVEIAPRPSLGTAMCENADNSQLTHISVAVPGRAPARQLLRAAATLWASQPESGCETNSSAPSRPGAQRYWWDEDADAKIPPSSSSNRYRLRWTTAARPPQRVAAVPLSWTAISGDRASATALADALAAHGDDVAVSGWNTAVDRLRPTGSQDARRGAIIDATGAPDPATDPEWHARLLTLVQTLGAAGTEVWVVTRSATTAGGPVGLGGAAVWGIARAVSAEHPDWWGGAIDLDHSAPLASQAARIVQEVLQGGVEDQVAYRGGARRVPRLTPAGSDTAMPITLDSDASYLVTGGSGTLGQRMVRWLVARGARHIVVASRSDVTAQRERMAGLVKEITGKGITVSFVQADVGRHADLEQIFAGSAHPWPPVRGVLHLAGHMTSAPFADTTPDDIRTSWAAKAAGAVALEEIAKQYPLDFVALFSSASSVWGSALATAYVAANYALDVIAERAGRQGLPFVSANWSWWPDTAMAEGVHEYFTRMGLGPVDETSGWSAMDRIIGGGETGVVVAPIDWAAFRPVMTARRPRPLFDAMSAVAVGDTSHTVERTSPWTRHEIAARAESSLQGVLHTDNPIDPQRGFFDMGVDSIMTLELKRNIERWTGLCLDDTFLFEHPRLSELTDALASKLLEPVETGDTVAAAPRTANKNDVNALDDLATDELIRLLEQELGSTKGPRYV
nr:type I polyketide synthase [Arthrobacter pigmenti]